ncbi:MAG: hypothetical protein US53_C0037G0006 [Candidatus Woesebacteria bacterium GW2011_GWA1_37_7]|uniref:7 transmembrane helices usually fused to an inactive transglutaminase domain-containing protein n=1 Tax=Candidatus Woesebacteria bacterium GW2011_GWA1_37_7 TaxID=1618545 RepID=A0A0G0H0N5_9BACT|nr:MAG: hypothetical protein US53_C0037G0006 [Candidatus Woesebacteria bacterium GW2011_GWA1_37_7]
MNFLNAVMLSSFRGNPVLQSGKDVIGLIFSVVILLFTPILSGDNLYAQKSATSSSAILVNENPDATESAEIVTPPVRADITQKTEESADPFKKLLVEQKLDSIWPYNPVKYAIRNAVNAGVPPNTIVLLLLLPGVAALIAAARHIVGIRGFGIFLPAALAVSFVATGPVIGIGLFLVIVIASTLTRIAIRRIKIKLQYLPRMSLMLLMAVIGVLGVLFLAPVIKHPDITNVSIFPVLVLVLLAEDFSRVQLGKSARIAVNMTSESLILALLSYFFLTFPRVQKFALLNPEWMLIGILLVNLLMGKYAGLRLFEYLRFRKLLKN